MPRLRRLSGLCSSTLSVNCEQVTKNTEEKILCRSLFSKRSHIGNLRQIRKQGKGRSPKRKGNRRCPFLFAPAVGTASSPPRGAARSRRPQTANPPAEVQRKTSRPLGANTLTQFACPAQSVQEKEPPRQGELACGSSCAPAFRCRKKGRTQNLTAKPLQTLFIATR